ncbi:MAG: hypothetical protein J7L96_11225 [Bacteroidales bacterium]|nr:hypothetical protein [Bacteroidales bacterium]
MKRAILRSFSYAKIVISIIIFLMIAGSCMPKFEDLPDQEEPLPDTVGILEIEFVIPDYQIPKNKIHLVDLSISTNAENAYKGIFTAKANVSDQQIIYQFKLTEGFYYYQAVITCSCKGDTCLNGGFPGGQYGFKYDIDKVLVEGGKTNKYKTMFQ